MTLENTAIPVLTFLVGLLIGLFYKYQDIIALKRDVATLERTFTSIGVVDLAANVKTMKESVLFTPEFQTQMLAICKEHDGMRQQIETNTNRLTALEVLSNARDGRDGRDGRDLRG